MTITKSETKAKNSQAPKVESDLASLHDLKEPYISSREVFPARHSVCTGLSPWNLGRDSALRSTVTGLTWTVVGYGDTVPVGDGSVVATETRMIVDVTATKPDGTPARMDNCECLLRTELDSRSLADRQLTGQGWLLPIGYTVVIDTPIA
ncbi:MAG: hypothetical protein WCC60_23095 [Ilumatobacteraceae bacterium]